MLTQGESSFGDIKACFTPKSPRGQHPNPAFEASTPIFEQHRTRHVPLWSTVSSLFVLGNAINHSSESLPALPYGIIAHKC
jgi:hypothetical protein